MMLHGLTSEPGSRGQPGVSWPGGILVLLLRGDARLIIVVVVDAGGLRQCAARQMLY